MPRIGGTRNPSLRGVMMVDTWRGQLRVRAWPKKRGKRAHPNTLKQNAWFSEASNLIKFADPTQYATAITRTKRTGLYPRDLLMRTMAGGIYDIREADGRVLTKRPKRFPDMAFQGAYIRRSNNLAVAAATATFIPWGFAVLNAGGFWSVGDPTKLTIPADVTVVRLNAGVWISADSTGLILLEIVRQDGFVVARQDILGTGSNGISVVGPPLDVRAGETYQARIFAANALTVSPDNGTAFGAEVIGTV